MGETNASSNTEILGAPRGAEPFIREVSEGQYQLEIELFFGEEAYPELLEAANEALATPLNRPVVLVCPGNLSTELLTEDGDTVWLCPLALSWDWPSLAYSTESPNLRPGDIISFVKVMYLRLVTTLMKRGHPVEMLPFDWRSSFVERIAQMTDIIVSRMDSFYVITHSEGGLVIRGALHELGYHFDELREMGEDARAASIQGSLDNVLRVVMVASPNFGVCQMVPSFQGEIKLFDYDAAAKRIINFIIDLFKFHPLTRGQARAAQPLIGELGISWLRGLQAPGGLLEQTGQPDGLPIFDEMRKWADTLFALTIGRLLATELIFTWPAWYQLLPFYNRIPELYEASNWPRDFPQPDQELLNRAEEIQRRLNHEHPQIHDKLRQVMGTGIRTLSEVHLDNHQLHYTYHHDGDGMVSVNFAELEDVPDQKIPGASHTELITDQRSVDAIISYLPAEE